jgi:hypothetical protein
MGWPYLEACRVAGDGAGVARRQQHAVREVGVQARLALWGPADESALKNAATLLPSGQTGFCASRVMHFCVWCSTKLSWKATALEVVLAHAL